MQSKRVIESITTILNDAQLSSRDNVKVLSQVLIDLGIKYEGHQPQLSLEDIKRIEKEYYEEPTLGKALILQGVLMTTWLDKA